MFHLYQCCMYFKYTVSIKPDRFPKANLCKFDFLILYRACMNVIAIQMDPIDPGFS